MNVWVYESLQQEARALSLKLHMGRKPLNVEKLLLRNHPKSKSQSSEWGKPQNVKTGKVFN